MEERRRHARAQTCARYKRLRREIDPPPALAEASGQFFAWFGRTKQRIARWLRPSRKLAEPRPGGERPA